MNRKILISTIIIIILIVLVGFLIYNFTVRQPIIKPINENVNLEPARVDVLSQALDNIEKIKEQDIFYDNYYQILEFLTFCNVKNNNYKYFEECSEVFNFYLFDPTPFREESINKWCRWDAYYVLIFYMRQGEKDRFMEICNEYKTLNMLINDCDQAWQTGFYANDNWCDSSEAELCWPILEDNESAAKISANYNRYEGYNLDDCAEADKVKINEVDLNNLKNLTCKKDIPLRRAKSAEDCQQIDDTLARLICLSEYDNNLCNEVQDAIDNYTIPEFEQKYDLQKCCFQGNKQGKARYFGAAR